MPSHTVDLSTVLTIGRDIATRCGELQGSEYSDDPRSDVRTPANARIHSDLLHLAHVCELQRLAVLNEYHRLRGHTSPDIRA